MYYIEIFAKCFADLETSEKVALHNYYVTMYDDACGNEIFENSEDFINERFPTPYDAINSIGRYNINDDWAWIDDLGKLYSADSESEMEFADVDDMAEYYFHLASYLKNVKGMEEWFKLVRPEEYEE